MYFYYVYGVNIASEIELDALLPAVADPDVTFRVDQIADKPCVEDGEFSAYWIKRDLVCIAYRDVASFLISGGEEIVIEPCEDADPTEIGHALLGMIISVLLYQRGYLVLHSSVIEVNGDAVAFLGHSGAGKSSISTAFHERGYKLISDDLAVVDLSDMSNIIVYSGFPQTKLWPDTIESIGMNPEDMPRINSQYTKRARRIREYFTDKTSLPLKQIYLLDTGDKIEVTDVKGHQSVVELVGYSYDIGLVELTNESANHFLQCAQLARNVSIRRLCRPLNLDMMAQVVKTVENDIERHTS